MGWALITHPQHWRGEKLLQAPMLIDERALAVARRQGWRLLVADHAPDTVNVEQNVQSNPIRHADPGDETP